MRLLSPLDDLLDLQDGVISRRQALALPGESEASLRRRLRRREWVTLHPGVYLNHTGDPTWHQRAWAAVLYAGTSALAGASALRAEDGPGRRSHDDHGPIHLIVPIDRCVLEQPGIAIERRSDFEAITRLNTSPPRVRVEHAAIDAAAGATTDLAAIGLLSDTVRARQTTPARLLEAVTARKRLRRRELILGVLSDAAAGAASALELEFLRRVERAHGLPTAMRQLRHVTGGAARAADDHTVYRDAELVDLGVVIELDGRLGHSTTADRDADLERDLDVALELRRTIRLGWGQCYARPCTTAVKLALILRQLGWRGRFRRCPHCPADLQLPDVA